MFILMIDGVLKPEVPFTSDILKIVYLRGSTVLIANIFCKHGDTKYILTMCILDSESLFRNKLLQANYAGRNDLFYVGNVNISCIVLVM